MTFYVDKYTVIHTPIFESELKYIVNYISFKLLEPNTAKKFYINVKLKIHTLQYFPERHVKIDLNNRVLRKLPINKYIVIYEVDNNTRTSLSLTYISWKSKLFKSFINKI